MRFSNNEVKDKNTAAAALARPVKQPSKRSMWTSPACVLLRTAVDLTETEMARFTVAQSREYCLHVRYGKDLRRMRVDDGHQPWNLRTPDETLTTRRHGEALQR